MRKLLTAGLCLLALCSLHAQKAKKKGSKKEQIKYIDPANMDFTIKPGDNFYLYANGTWIKNNPVPASKTRWSNFDILHDGSLEKIRILCQDAADSTGKNTVYQRVGDFYASGMDSTTIENLGYSPIKPELARLAAITTKEQVLNEFTTLRTKGVGGVLFGFRVEQDDKNVNQYIAGLAQGGTSLPDRDYYLKEDPRSKAIRAAFVSYVTDLFTMTGDDSMMAKHKATAIINGFVA